MSIYAISDLHLSFGENKPMDIFGVNWENHTEKIAEDWKKRVKKDDLVLIPGDFSWAMYLQDTYKDFEYLNNLPGKKLLLKGNHDYWWTTINKMREYLKENNFENIDFIYNNSYIYENIIIAGTRGWGNVENKEDEKITKREKIRLELSLKDGVKKYGEDKQIVVCMHFPPFNNIDKLDMNYIETMKEYNVIKCIYGHIHGDKKYVFEGNKYDIDFKLVSCDNIKFKLIEI